MHDLRVMKAKRVARRIPLTAVKGFCEPILNASQVLALAVSVIGTFLILQTASPTEADREMASWYNAATAFGYVMVVWAAYSLIRAPFRIVYDDRARGKWSGHHFTYHQPLLVATERFVAGDGTAERRSIRFDDAEPDSFVYYTLVAEPNVGDGLGAILQGIIRYEMEDGSDWVVPYGDRFFGTRLPRDRSAALVVRLEPKTRPVVVRVYCHSFFVGKDDKTHA